MTARMATMRTNCCVQQVGNRQGGKIVRLQVEGNNGNKFPSRPFLQRGDLQLKRRPVSCSLCWTAMAAIFWKFSSVPGPRITWRDWEESRMWPLSSQVVEGVPHSWFLRVNCYLESYTIDDFAEALRLTSNDLHNLKLIFHSVEQGDLGVLSAIGVKVKLA